MQPSPRNGRSDAKSQIFEPPEFSFRPATTGRRLAQADAEALFRDHGAQVYGEARQREHEAGSDAMVKHWGRVALAIAKKTGKRVSVELGRDDTD